MRNIDLFDDYLKGNLSREQQKEFDLRLVQDTDFSDQFSKHQRFVALLKEQQQQSQLKNKLKTLHQEHFPANNVFYLAGKNNFFKKYIQPVSVAASIAIIAVISTIAILSFGGYLINNQNETITVLNKKVERLENTDKLIINKFAASGRKKNFAPANFEGTGFALNNKGYLITSLHIVKGADSIFIENNSIERAPAKIIHTDARLDLAILKLDSATLFAGKDIPWVLKSKEADLGEKIFTLGYPSSNIVYGEGSISSSTGSGDTTMYQISIPVNPGNSGGPLLDEQGNIIGLVRGKNSKAEGTGFAVKAAFITDLIQGIADPKIKSELTLPKKNMVKFLKRSEQIKRIEPFVFNVKIYKAN